MKKRCFQIWNLRFCIFHEKSERKCVVYEQHVGVRLSWKSWKYCILHWFYGQPRWVRQKHVFDKNFKKRGQGAKTWCRSNMAFLSRFIDKIACTSIAKMPLDVAHARLSLRFPWFMGRLALSTYACAVKRPEGAKITWLFLLLFLGLPGLWRGTWEEGEQDLLAGTWTCYSTSVPEPVTVTVPELVTWSWTL